MDTFQASVSDCEYDFVCLTETGMTDDINSSELFPDRYCVVRCDRDRERTALNGGGGVLIAGSGFHQDGAGGSLCLC